MLHYYIQEITFHYKYIISNFNLICNHSIIGKKHLNFFRVNKFIIFLHLISFKFISKSPQNLFNFYTKSYIIINLFCLKNYQDIETLFNIAYFNLSFQTFFYFFLFFRIEY